MKRTHRLTLLAAAAGAAFAAHAADNEVVVTGSIAERAAVEAPYAIGSVDAETIRNAGPQINLSEALSRVPGIMVGNRSNFAQDLQITSRGYGARATFGVRGIRLLADGIPASGPDGQGQVSQFDLANAERVEVLRGPFSVLYGNSSGGVISLVTAPVKQPRAEGEVDVGSFGLRQVRAGVGLKPAEGLDLRISGSLMQIDGFRPESEARRRLLNARLGWKAGDDSVVVTAGYFSQPAQDPLGLTRAQFDADPLSTAPQATQFDTRKDQTQTQLGTVWKHRFGEGALRDLQVMAYAGRRGVTQLLAIPATTQNGNTHSGGVVDFDRDYAGTEVKLRFGWQSFDLQIGAAIDDQRDARRGFLSFTGPVATPTYGEIGALKRDETDRARTTDLFAQAEWAVAPSLALTGGLRTGRVKLSVQDHFIDTTRTPNNNDDSGSLSFSYTNPVLGLRWDAAPGLRLHASVARGFESPTLGEIAYRADGVSGVNFALQPQKSRQMEVGAKWRAGVVDADFAVFDIRTDDEIGVATNAGGRSAFQNVGRTKRSGFELGSGARAGDFTGRLAVTWLNATYLDSFTTCTGVPCNAANPANIASVPAGNRIAGTQRASGFAELAWNSGVAGTFGVEARGVSATVVDDRNTDAAGRYVLGALRWSMGIPVGGFVERVELLARVDNVTDKRYAGSVIVNESNGRFFEPGAPRAFFLGARVALGL